MLVSLLNSHAEILAPRGIRSQNEILKSLWKRIHRHCRHTLEFFCFNSHASGERVHRFWWLEAGPVCSQEQRVEKDK